MKKLIAIILLFVATSQVFGQVYRGEQSNQILQGTKKVKLNERNGNVEYFEFSSHSLKSGLSVNAALLKQKTGLSSNYQFKQPKKIVDAQGNTHEKYQLYFNDIPVEGMGYHVHYKNGAAQSANGHVIKTQQIQSEKVIPEYRAIEKAIAAVNAETYIWERNPSMYPTAELLFVPTDSSLVLCYKIDVYALEPLMREYVYINAKNGQVYKRRSRIHHADAHGTAITQYNGTVEITTNDDSGLYTLSETSRGNGIITYNMNHGTIYENASMFTDEDNHWDIEEDKVAYDAHYGSEKTYDFYYDTFGRNSIDDQGFALKSYVHFDTDYANAFWDGEKMTYGDGNGYSTSALTCLDIVGHEITHGLITNTANLEYADESGALNESFADIFGVAIDFYAHPESANYLIGEKIYLNETGVIRSMEDPNSVMDPDTYQGNYWVTGTYDNGGVHTNSSVQNYWFYLLCKGGSGVNDKGDNYIVEAIGIDAAAAIAYRNLTVYLSRYSDFEDARFYAIQSAVDLYGACSNEVIQVSNAWHAVGVGEPFTDAVTAGFTVDQKYYCSVPAEVMVENISINASSYRWYVNDELYSIEENPTLELTTLGSFDIKLIVEGSSECNGADTVELKDYITVSNMGTPVDPLTAPQSIYGGTGGIYIFKLNEIDHHSMGADEGYMDYSCEARTYLTEGKLYDVYVRTGSSNNEKVAMWLDLNNNGDFSDEGELIWENLAGKDHQGEVFIPQGSVYGQPIRLRLGSDRADVANLNAQSNTYYGQYEDYTVILEQNVEAPEAFFTQSDTVVSIQNSISFTDQSLNLPGSWYWEFEGGEPATSNEANPVVTYNTAGTYSVSLTVANTYGSSSVQRTIAVADEFIMGVQPQSRAASGYILDSGGDEANYSNLEEQQFLIKPYCAESILLQFESFDTEGCCDGLYIYDGSTDAAPLLKTIKGSTDLTETITATSGAMLLVFKSDASVTKAGFKAQWNSVGFEDGDAVVADFSTLDGNLPLDFPLTFTDESLNNPYKWNWNFGDGQSSTEQNPIHQFTNAGNYNVELSVDNCFGKDVISKELTVDAAPELSISTDTVRFNLVSGEKIDSFLTLSNISGGVLAYGAELRAIYEKGNNPFFGIDTSNIVGFNGISANGRELYASVPVIMDGEPGESIVESVIERSYELTKRLWNIKVGLGSYVYYYNDLKNALIANGASCTQITASNVDTNLSELDVLIVDDSGDFLESHQQTVRDWVEKGGFLIIQGDGIKDAYNAVLEGSGISYYSSTSLSTVGVLMAHPITSNILSYEIAQKADCRLNIQEPAIQLINDGNGYCYAGLSQRGTGMFLAIGNEAFQYMTYDGHEALLINSIEECIASINGHAVQVAPGYQYVGVNENDSVDFTIDTEGVIQGEYVADIQIESNDPERTIVDIPLLLSITGIENILVSETDLWFPKVFVNNTDSISFTIGNDGTRELEISQIVCTNSAFSVDFEPMVMAPGEGFAFQLNFTPQLNQIYSGTLQIHSSDPDTPVYEIPVSGNCVLPPVIGLPSGLSHNLFSWESLKDELIISNQNGGSALAIDSVLIKNISNTAGILSDTTQVDLAGIHIQTPGNSNYDFMDAMISNGALVTNVLDTIKTGDVICVNANSSYYLSDENINFVSSWVENGGGLYIEANNAEVSTGLMNLISSIGVQLNELSIATGLYSATNHTVMNRVEPGELIDYANSYLTYDEGTALILDDQEQSFAVAINHGYGRIIISSFEALYQFSNDHQQLFALNAMRWLSNKKDWIWVSDYPTDSIAAGESHVLSVDFNASGKMEGSYRADIEIYSNDPVHEFESVPITLNVTGIPMLALANDTLELENEYVNYQHTDSLMIYNPGTSNLEIYAVTSPNEDFTCTVSESIIQPRTTAWIYTTYAPTTAGSDDTYLLLQSNASELADTVYVKAQALEAPEMSITPQEVNIKLGTGESYSQAIEIHNAGGSILNYQVNLAFDSHLKEQSLQGVLDSLNVHYEQITNHIPNKFSFIGGEAGKFIADGGGDMFDNGNYLSTNVGAHFSYADNQVVLSDTMGVDGQYFTRKYDGLFVFAADLNQVSEFAIGGGLGADGNGNVDVTVLSSTINGETYTGYVKRVYGTGDPSVNHLIIIKENDAVVHSYSNNTDLDTHALLNLSNTKRIYYLLYGASAGTYIDNETTHQMMDAFIQITEGAQGWMESDRYQGTVDSGTSEVLNLNIEAGDMPEGNYVAQVIVNSNDPANAVQSATVNLQISNNMAPIVETPISNMLIYTTYQDTIDLNKYFSDPDGDYISYTVSSTDNNILFPLVQNESNLILSPLEEGSVQVTVDAVDEAGDQVSYTFDVMVRLNHKPTAVLELDDLNMRVGDESTIVNLNYHFSDADGDDLIYTVTSNQEGIADCTIGGNILMVDPLAEGNIIVTISADDGKGMSISRSFAVIVGGLSTTSLENISEGIQVYPNPVESLLHLKVNEGAEIISAQLLDVKGNVVAVAQENYQEELRWEVSGLPTGFYILKVFTPEKEWSFKVLKK